MSREDTRTASLAAAEAAERGRALAAGEDRDVTDEFAHAARVPYVSPEMLAYARAASASDSPPF
jgi:hypothetical protein